MNESVSNMRRAVLYCIIVAISGLSCARAEQSPPPVQSSFEGTITIRPEVNPSKDYRGFEVLVAQSEDGEPDTLSYAVTDSSGYFSMQVTAPVRGMYGLVISRVGQILASGRIVIADGDSASLVAAFPLNGRTMRIRSLENSAWQAYQNTLAQHEQELLELVQSGAYEEEVANARFSQTTTILWDLQQTFPNSMAGELAAAEAIVMGSGWNDSLAVARMRALPSSNVRFTDAVRSARHAQARLADQSAALALLDELTERTESSAQRAEIASERVLAHIDSSQFDAALEVAQTMQEDFVDTQWATWGERAAYEIQNLLPGMEALNFAVRDANGDSLSLRDLRGKHVILEFYRPEDDLYQRELPGRNNIFTVLGADQVEIVSISMQPDTLVNEAFFEERIAPGRHVYGGLDVAQQYNIHVLPTRYVIDPQGNLVNKYVGGTMAALYEDMVRLSEQQ
ncbi:MAG: redoxin domain-containing protein [Bacteroidota bacterium]|nr:redoxin domain-containing protein [Bacteroidota bacterium]